MQDIPLESVESHQIAAIGHDAATEILAIQFKSWKGGTGSTYYYSNFTVEDFAAFKAAESKGKHFGEHIKPFAEKFPYTKVA